METFELSLKLASLVGDGQAQDAIKKALKDVNSKIVEGIKTETNATPDVSNQPLQAAEDEGEKNGATEDDGEDKETAEDVGENKTTEDDNKPPEDVEQEQLDT